MKFCQEKLSDLKRKVSGLHDLHDAAAPPWSEEIDFCHFEAFSGLFTETTFFLKRYKAVLMADMAFASLNGEGIPTSLMRFVYPLTNHVSLLC